MKDYFQRFDLDINQIMNQMKGKKSNELKALLTKLHKARKDLKDRLVSKGYNVLESSNNIGGLPNSIAVFSNFDQEPILDFQQVASELELRYRTIDHYL